MAIGCKNVIDRKFYKKTKVWYCEEKNEMVTIENCKRCKYNTKIEISDKDKVDYVNDILIRYTEDVIGEKFKEKFLEMSYEEKINLYNNAKSMNNNEEDFDFDTDIVINFDFSNY